MGPNTQSDVTDLREVNRAAFLAGCMRRETALLLGAQCADDGLAAMDLPGEFSRTAEWRAALERGDFIPTFEMVNQLDGVLILKGQLKNYSQLAVDLESFPLGQRAQTLRTTYGVTPDIEPVAANSIEIGSGLSLTRTPVDG